MTRIRMRGGFMVLLFLAFAPFLPNANADPILLGQTVWTAQYYPNLSTIYGVPAMAVVGSGVEFPVFGRDSIVSIDFSDTNITISWLYGYRALTGDFNGFRFWDVYGTIPAIMSVTLTTNIERVDASNVSFDADNIYINFSGATVTANSFASLELTTTASVPEPSTLILLTLGLVGLIGYGWRHSRG